MSSNTGGSDGYETYYVPEQSSFPILASIGLFLSVFGAGTFINQISAGESGNGQFILLVGLAFFCTVLFYWFKQAISENMAALSTCP